MRKPNALTADLIDRFSVVVPSGCFVWVGERTPNGYGRVRVAGRKLVAHRVAYEIFVGPIPPNLTIDHLCRERSCVNWRHLEAVPGHVNMLRGISFAAQNARKTHCKRGHEFTPENTIASGKNSRMCRCCKTTMDREYARSNRDSLRVYHRMYMREYRHRRR